MKNMSSEIDRYNQVKKPTGPFGRETALRMNCGEHEKLAAWAWPYFPAEAHNIADLGCGGGKNIERLMNYYKDSFVTGLDYSDVSVEVSKEVNAAAIKAGKCKVIKGDVSNMEFADGSFDMVTAFETMYFWPGPEVSINEVYRILKKGGIFMIIHESNGEDEKGKEWEKMTRGLRTYSAAQLRDHLTVAGFKNIKAFHEKEKEWLCIRAEK